jgi:hypothetical protein
MRLLPIYREMCGKIVQIMQITQIMQIMQVM